MFYNLPKLNFAFDDLEPLIDSRTIEIHFTKHHNTYVTNLNATLKSISWNKNISVEELISDIKSLPESIRQSVQDNGGGHANHNLFWDILSTAKNNNNKIPNTIETEIIKSFGSISEFQAKLTKSALAHVGSGWAWLFLNNKNELEIGTTTNHDSPLMKDFCKLQGKPIFVIDLWEHSYYLKYQNRRSEYIESFWKLLNWDKVNANFISQKK